MLDNIMKKSTELRTLEEQKKYDQAVAWLSEFAVHLKLNSVKQSEKIKTLMAEMDRLYPETNLMDDNENI